MRAFGGDETALAAALEGRRYDAPLRADLGSTTLREMLSGEAGNMLGACLRAFVAADMGRIANDEIAVQLACRAAGGGR